LGLSWDAGCRNAHGFIIGFNEADYYSLWRYGQCGLPPVDSVKHGLQIPLLLIEAVLRRDANDLRNQGLSLFTMQAKLPLELGLDKEASLSLNMWKKMNFAAQRLAFLKMRLEGFNVVVDDIVLCARRWTR